MCRENTRKIDESRLVANINPEGCAREGSAKKESREKGEVYLRKITFSRRNRGRMQISAPGTIINGEQGSSRGERKKF